MHRRSLQPLVPAMYMMYLLLSGACWHAPWTLLAASKAAQKQHTASQLGPKSMMNLYLCYLSNDQVAFISSGRNREPCSKNLKPQRSWWKPLESVHTFKNPVRQRGRRLPQPAGTACTRRVSLGQADHPRQGRGACVIDAVALRVHIASTCGWAQRVVQQ